MEVTAAKATARRAPTTTLQLHSASVFARANTTKMCTPARASAAPLVASNATASRQSVQAASRQPTTRNTITT